MGLFYLLVAVLALGALPISLSRTLRLQGDDALCASPVIVFLALNASALVPSFFEKLNGPTWAGMLLALAALAFWTTKKWAIASPEPVSARAGQWPDFLLIGALTFPVLVNQIIRPVLNFDDLMYHGSRAGYWLTNQSILPFPVHNDRLVAFPVGGDLWFALGVLTTQGEVAGKVLVFLAYPFSLVLMLATARMLGVRDWLARVAVVLVACIPLFRAGAVGIKPDLWLVVFSLTAVLWFMRWKKGDAVSDQSPLWLALSLGCALGVKWTIAPLFVLLVPVLWTYRAKMRRVFAILTVLTGAVALGGAGLALIHNMATTGHPIGTKLFREVHKPDPGWKVASIHLVRVPFQMVDFPIFPDEELRAATIELLGGWADALGATKELTWEEPGSLPGPFRPEYEMVGNRFSLLWIILLSAMVMVPWLLWKMRRSPGASTLLFLSASVLLLFLTIVFQVRWQPQALLPDRLLLPGLIVGVLLWAWAWERTLATNRAATLFLVTLVAFHSIPFLLHSERVLTTAAATGWSAPTDYSTQSPWEEAARAVGSGKSVLLFASQGALDYPLFDPQGGFSNRVWPWGKLPYDSARFEALLNARRIDTIVFEQAAPFQMLWDADFDPVPFISEAESLPDFEKVSTRMGVVFLRK